jgi:hypothetical protein
MAPLRLKRRIPDIEGMKQLNDIRGLIRFLGDRNFTVQWQAAAALGTMGQAPIDQLIKELHHPDRNVRLGIIEALGDIRAPEAVPALIALLESDRRAEIRWAITLALGEIGDQEAVPSLGRALRDPDKYVRYGAAIALDRLDQVPDSPFDKTYYLIAKHEWERLKTEKDISVDALLQATRDRDPQVRIKAVEVIGELKDPLACSAIAPALRDRDSRVLWKAVTSFQQCGVSPLYMPMGVAKRPRFGKNPWVAAFLNFFFVGLGYNYLGMWWGFLLFQTNLTIVVLVSLEIGPLIPTVVSYSVSALFSIHSWFMARNMQVY